MAMRRIMEPLLPPNVVWRKDKHHLGWLLNLLVLKSQADYFHQVLDESRDSLEAYIDLGKLDHCWDHFFSTGENKPATLIWDAIALALWLRRQNDLVS